MNNNNFIFWKNGFLVCPICQEKVVQEYGKVCEDCFGVDGNELVKIPTTLHFDRFTPERLKNIIEQSILDSELLQRISRKVFGKV